MKERISELASSECEVEAIHINVTHFLWEIIHAQPKLHSVRIAIQSAGWK